MLSRFFGDHEAFSATALVGVLREGAREPRMPERAAVGGRVRGAVRPAVTSQTEAGREEEQHREFALVRQAVAFPDSATSDTLGKKNFAEKRT